MFLTRIIAMNSKPEMFGIQGPEAYVYTSRSNCLQVTGIDDVEDFAETNVS
jgi:myosin-1